MKMKNQNAKNLVEIFCASYSFNKVLIQIFNPYKYCIRPCIGLLSGETGELLELSFHLIESILFSHKAYLLTKTVIFKNMELLMHFKHQMDKHQLI